MQEIKERKKRDRFWTWTKIAALWLVLMMLITMTVISEPFKKGYWATYVGVVCGGFVGGLLAFLWGRVQGRQDFERFLEEASDQALLSVIALRAKQADLKPPIQVCLNIRICEAHEEGEEEAETDEPTIIQ